MLSVKNQQGIEALFASLKELKTGEKVQASAAYVYFQNGSSKPVGGFNGLITICNDGVVPSKENESNEPAQYKWNISEGMGLRGFNFISEQPKGWEMKHRTCHNNIAFKKCNLIGYHLAIKGSEGSKSGSGTERFYKIEIHPEFTNVVF